MCVVRECSVRASSVSSVRMRVRVRARVKSEIETERERERHTEGSCGAIAAAVRCGQNKRPSRFLPDVHVADATAAKEGVWIGVVAGPFPSFPFPFGLVGRQEHMGTSCLGPSPRPWEGHPGAQPWQRVSQPWQMVRVVLCFFLIYFLFFFGFGALFFSPRSLRRPSASVPPFVLLPHAHTPAMRIILAFPPTFPRMRSSPTPPVRWPSSHTALAAMGHPARVG